MYKLVIVEDECDVRKRLVGLIEKSGCNFEIVSEYETGIDAYDGIISDNPDLILTDIKIPYINGIELSKMVREIYPLVKIIIITGYSEFDYAKEAANLGVIGFVSKPITLENIQDLLKKAEVSLDKEFLTVKNLDRLSEFYHSNLSTVREKELYSLSKMTEVTPAFEERLHNGNININYSYFAICIFDFDEQPDSEPERHDLAFSSMRILIDEEFAGFFDCDIFSRNEKLCLIIKSSTEPDIRELELCIERIIQRTGRFSEMPVSAGLSKIYHNNRNFFAMVKEANRALEYRSVMGGGKVFLYEISADNVERNLRLVTSYMEEHYCDPDISFESLAREVNFSVSYISALLKKKLNTSFVKMLTDLRMKKAKELLSNPSLKIIDIAEQLGYNDAYYFSHCFKKKVGVPPKEFRNEQNK